MLKAHVRTNISPLNFLFRLPISKITYYFIIEYKNIFWRFS